MKRYHDEIPLMERRVREHFQISGGLEVPRLRGHYRKRHPLDCGKSRCQCCHGDTKFPKRKPTRKELMHDQQQDD